MKKVKQALIVVLLALCGCWTDMNSRHPPQSSNQSNGYNLPSGSTVYCWFVAEQKSGSRGYTFDDGKGGDVPPLVGKPFQSLKDVAKQIKFLGATNIILSPYYPAKAPVEWEIRDLSDEEVRELSSRIEVLKVEDRTAPFNN